MCIQRKTVYLQLQPGTRPISPGHMKKKKKSSGQKLMQNLKQADAVLNVLGTRTDTAGAFFFFLIMSYFLMIVFKVTVGGNSCHKAISNKYATRISFLSKVVPLNNYLEKIFCSWSCSN